MKTINIENDADNIYVKCPHCEMTEQQPIDQQRHHLQVFVLKIWLEDHDSGFEQSVMECCSCKNEFKLTWDYSNNHLTCSECASDIDLCECVEN